MFGFGDDSEHKLEENMEEIKNLVDDQAETDELPDETDQWARQGLEDTDFSSEELDMGDAEQLMEDEPQQENTAQQQQTEQKEKPLEDEIESFEESLEEERSTRTQNVSERREQPRKNRNDNQWENEQAQPPREEQNYREESPRREKDSVKGSVRADIPEPAETKQLDVPEIEKGPLFIRQRKFERATQLIYDMKYLADEIESIVNTIEGDLQRDEDTENQLREILGEFKDGRTEVERIVSVGEE